VDGFIKRGFTEAQAKLKAVWENPNIASICSQMPNMTILKANRAAALDRTTLTGKDLQMMKRYARETAASYCTGCAGVCESALADEVPVCDVMRYLMYSHGYGDRDRARRLFHGIPARIRRRMLNADYSCAENKCPQGMPIGQLMKTAVSELG
jgi:predicted aldo/keto reductase-like oxidoreductase